MTRKHKRKLPMDLTDRHSIFASLPRHGIGAEIGVAWGCFSKDIIRLAEPRLMYLIDCWEMLPTEVTGHDPANSSQENKDGQYHQVLSWFVADPKVRVVKGFSQQVAPMFPDEFFDWLYIDANHLQCREDCIAWWPKIKSGGYAMGHDYCVVGDFITVKPDVDRFSQEIGVPVQVTIDADTAYKNWVIAKP